MKLQRTDVKRWDELTARFSGGAKLNEKELLVLTLSRDDASKIITNTNKIHLFKHFCSMRSSAVPKKSLFYDIDADVGAIEKLFSLSEGYLVEQLLDGFPVTIHKCGDLVKIYDDNGKDVTKKFNSITDQVKKLNGEDIILDGKIVAIIGRLPTGKQAVETFINTKSSLQESQMVFVGIDVPYFDGVSHHDSTIYTRKKLLSPLELNTFSNLREVGFTLVREPSDLLISIDTVSKLPASEGAILKDIDSIYSFENPSDKWIEFRKAHKLSLKVLDSKEGLEGKTLYTVGLPIPQGREGFVLEGFVKGHNFVLGTINSDSHAEIGDVVEVTSKEIHRHTNKLRNVGYSIHKAILVATPNRELSSLSDVDLCSMRTGIEIIENE